MKNNYKEALTEVDEILNYVPTNFIEKIPIKLRNFIKENKSENYTFHINETISLEKQNVRDETKSFIAILLLKYWDKEHKEELIKKYNENDIIYQQKLHEKYNVNVFDKTTKNSNIQNEDTKTDIIEYKKENFFIVLFKNIFNNIKRIFKF